VKKTIVCHITTVHSERDVRIFHKECKSLAKAGFDVKLIVINGKGFTEDGIEAIGIPCEYKGRLQRFTKAPKIAYKKAIELNAEIYHFHDPELLPTGLKLKKRGKKVIYDVHEDLPRQILSKYYLPRPIRKFVSYIIEKYENRVARKLDQIITATPHIRDRFLKINKNTTDINNFPVSNVYKKIPDWAARKQEVCYVGGLSEIRGTKEIVSAASNLKNISIHLAGDFDPKEIRNKVINIPGWENIIEHGFVSRDEARKIMDNSIAGLVVFHPEPNHINAQPNKIFEYMSAGLPVIGSAFPLWKEIIVDHECGICVDPLIPSEIADAIKWIANQPDRAMQMGLNGTKLVKEKYNWKIEEQKLIQVYNSLEKNNNKV